MNDFIDMADIRKLLERYFEGETSPRDENALREYFASQADIPPDMEYARAMFGYFGKAAEAKAEKEFLPPADPERQPSPPAKRRFAAARRSRRLRILAGSAAAAVILAIAIPFAMPDGRDNGETIYCYINGEPITDYELAYAYAQGALGLIEDNFRKPGECLASVSDAENTLNGLQYFEESHSYHGDKNE